MQFHVDSRLGMQPARPILGNTREDLVGAASWILVPLEGHRIVTSSRGCSRRGDDASSIVLRTGKTESQACPSTTNITMHLVKDLDVSCENVHLTAGREASHPCSGRGFSSARADECWRPNAYEVARRYQLGAFVISLLVCAFQPRFEPCFCVYEAAQKFVEGMRCTGLIGHCCTSSLSSWLSCGFCRCR